MKPVYRLYIVFLITLLAIPVELSAQRTRRRPKVALVLSGGGAKGAAHVGALKVIEKAGIPIDMVVGTSMGALVGGLYSVGYTPDQIDSLLRAQDWKVLLSDAEDPKNATLIEMLENKQYAIEIPFESKRISFNEGGFLRGVNLGHLFHQLVYPYNYDIPSFDRLPIPFSCVAVDLVNGEPYEFHSGSLQDAMRASMSIPGVFTPVRMDGHIFVDGGLRDNYPTDVALRMGANVVIGVSVESGLKKGEEVNKLGEVLVQALDVAMMNPYQGSEDQTTIHIPVNVQGYNAASFSSEAIDTLLNRGFYAAMQKWNDLDSLSKDLQQKGRKPRYGRNKKEVLDMERSLELELTEPFTPVSLYNKYSNDKVGLSVHYDNINDVSLLLRLGYNIPVEHHNLFLDVSGKLGSRNFFKPSLSYAFSKKAKMTFGYEYHKIKNETFEGEDRAVNMRNFQRHRLNMEYSFSKNSFYLLGGVDYNDNTVDIMSSDTLGYGEHARYFTYYARGRYNTYDNLVYPQKGFDLKAECKVASDNMFSNHSDKPMIVFTASASKAISLPNNFVIIPSVDFRCVQNPNNEYIPLYPFVGGISEYSSFEGQRNFAGALHMQYLGMGTTLTGTVNALYNFYKKHYLVGAFNNLFFDEKIGSLLSGGKYYGGMAGYMYRSPVGPVSLQFHYSNLENGVGVLVSAGFIF